MSPNYQTSVSPQYQNSSNPSPQLQIQSPPINQNSSSPKTWAPVQSPVLTPTQPPNFQQSPTICQPAPYLSPPLQLARPTGLLTLRKEAPVHQKPAPVFASQPATATLGGK